MIEYPQFKHLPVEYIVKKLSEFLEEDISDGDETTQCTIPENTNIKAEIQTVDELVFAGKIIIPHCFGNDCRVEIDLEDGDTLVAGELMGKIRGPARAILSRERVMLNLIQRLCGIATVSRQYAEVACPFNVKILDKIR